MKRHHHPSRVFFIGLLGLLWLLMAMPEAMATEAGVDISERVRKRLHEDTDSYDTQLIIRDTSVFAGDTIGEEWKWKVSQILRKWQIKGAASQPLVDVNISQTDPSLVFDKGPYYLRGILIRASLSPSESVFEKDEAFWESAFWLPGLDFRYKQDERFTWKLGGWRELDFHTFPNRRYTPVIYQAMYGSMVFKPQEQQELEARLFDVSRVHPRELPLERNEYDVEYRLNDPMEQQDQKIWEQISLKYAIWHYTSVSEQIWYLILNNRFRFTGERITQILTHRLTTTNSYTTYQSGRQEDSIIELDKTDRDVRNLLEYTAFGRVGESAMYWRATYSQEDSLVKKAYQENRLNVGASMSF